MRTDLMDVEDAPSASLSPPLRARAHKRHFDPPATSTTAFCVVDCLRQLIDRESRKRIYSLAGPLTQYLHSELPLPISESSLRIILDDAFLQDKPAVLRHLPAYITTLPLDIELISIRSHAMKRAARFYTLSPSVHESATGYDMIEIGLAFEPWQLLTGFHQFLHKHPDNHHHPLAIRGFSYIIDHILNPRHGRFVTSELLQTRGFVGHLLECVAGMPQTPPSLVAYLMGFVTEPLSYDAFYLAGMHGNLSFIQNLCQLDAQHRFCDSNSSSISSMEIASQVASMAASISPATSACQTASTAAVTQNLTFDGALVSNNKEIFDLIQKHMVHEQHRVSREAIQQALSLGSTATLWQLLSNQTMFNCYALESIKQDCAMYGEKDLLVLALSHGIGSPLHYSSLVLAARNGHLEIVTWLMSQSVTMQDFGDGLAATQMALLWAAYHGHQAIVEFLAHWRADKKRALLSRGGSVDSAMAVDTNDIAFEVIDCDAIIWASQSGVVETFVWLWIHAETDIKRPSLTDMIPAVVQGHYWIIEQYVQLFNASVRSLSIETRHTSLQKEFDGLLECALSNGHLEMAKMLVARAGAVPSASMMDSIIEAEQLHCGRWLHQQVGGGYSETVRHIHCTKDQMELLAFLMEISTRIWY